MATFDAATFAKGLMDPVRQAVAPFASKATDEARELVRDLDILEKSTASTLGALATVTTDDRMARLLTEDLEKFLPARRAALVARTANLLASDVQGALEAALTVVEKAAIIAARAFVGF